MNKTSFVGAGSVAGHFHPNQTQVAYNSTHGSIKDVKVIFRDTGYGGKTKNRMYKTTYGLKDEFSDDTVSTEFNYLQPTVRRLDARASIQTNSHHGGIIHVQEQKVQSSQHKSDSRDSYVIQTGGGGITPLGQQAPVA